MKKQRSAGRALSLKALQPDPRGGPSPKKLLDCCISEGERAVVCRCFKEASIKRLDFEQAAFFRKLEIAYEQAHEINQLRDLIIIYKKTLAEDESKLAALEKGGVQ